MVHKIGLNKRFLIRTKHFNDSINGEFKRACVERIVLKKFVYYVRQYFENHFEPETKHIVALVGVIYKINCDISPKGIVGSSFQNIE